MISSQVRWLLKTNKAANTKSKELSAELRIIGVASNNSFLISSLNAPSKSVAELQRVLPLWSSDSNRNTAN
ncbi:hypothetical protein YC2023_112621 [Brassica napus]